MMQFRVLIISMLISAIGFQPLVARTSVSVADALFINNMQKYDTVPDSAARFSGPSLSNDDSTRYQVYYYKTYYADNAGRIYNLPGYDGAHKCNWPLDNERYEEIQGFLKSESFESRRLKSALLIADNNCFTSDQVRELASLFDFEESKLEFAQKAFLHTFDTEHFSKVTDVLDFAASIEELDAYMKLNK